MAVLRVGLRACRYTVIGANPDCTYSSEGQLQGSRVAGVRCKGVLHSLSCKVWGCLLVQILGFNGVGGERAGWDLCGWHLGTQNLWAQNWSNFQEVHSSCACYCFLLWQKLLGSSTKQVTGNHVYPPWVPTTGNPCRFLFSLVASLLYTSQLFRSLGGVKPKQVLSSVPWKAEKACHSPCLPFPGEGNSSWLESSLALKQCWPWGWNDASKMKLFFLPFWGKLFSGYFVPLCC